jgi:GTP-binding protein
VDKLARKTAADRVRALAESLSLDDSQVIAFSAVTGEGRDELAEAVAALVGAAPSRQSPVPSP